MKKLLLPVAALLAFQSFAATNYALRTNGARFAGPVQANRAIDGKTDTYWGFHPYPKGFVLKLQDTCKIDTLKIVFYKTGVYTFKAEYSLDNVNYTEIASGVAKGTFEKKLPALPMKYLRLTVLHNKTNRGIHVCELELLGADGQLKARPAPQPKAAPGALTAPGRRQITKVKDGQIFFPVHITGSSFYKVNHKKSYYGPELTGDGKTGSFSFYWASDFKNKAPAPHWITFDFGKNVTFNAIQLHMVERYNFSVICNDFKIEYFDGKAWKVLINEPHYASKFFSAVKSNDPEKRYTAVIPDSKPTFHFPAVTGSKVRFSTMDPIARLDEMTVINYNKRPVPEPIPAPRAFDDGIMRFSFAPAGIPLRQGFIRPELKSSGKIFYVDRGHPDDLRRCFAAGTGDATLSVKVPAKGIYQVMVMGGDQFASFNGTDFTINGKNYRLPAVPKSQFPREIYTLEAEKTIDITFKGNWLVNAVMIFPLEKEKALRQELTDIVIGRDCNRFKADPQPTHSFPYTPSAEDVKRGFVNFTTPIDQRVFAATTPKKEQCVKTITALAAGDTIKAVSTNFRFLKHIPDFKVTYSGKLKATLHPVKNWLQRTGHKGSARTYWKVPELLGDNTAFFAVKETTVQYYLLFEIPAKTRPGVYKSALKVTGKGIPETVLPVEFTVLPFTLDRADSAQYAAMYTADYNRPFTTGNSDPALDRLRLEDMRRHNMNSILFPSEKFTSEADFKKLYLLANKRLDECGFPRFPMALHNQNFTVEQVKFIQKTVKETGLREILYYPVDEPHFGRRHIAEKMYPLVKSVPGTRSYSTVTEEDIASFGKYLDFRVYMITGYAKFEPDRIVQDCKKDKAHFYWYSNSGREYPGTNRYKAGYFAWRCGSTGQLYWAYENTALDPWNDFDGRAHDHNAVYIFDNKIYSTIQWEAIREGIDDFRYITMLEKLIAANPRHPAAVSGKALLARLRKDTCVDLNEYQKRFGRAIDVHRFCWWAPEKLELYRNAVIAEIMKFLRKK